jgi:hypothetical protein
VLQNRVPTEKEGGVPVGFTKKPPPNATPRFKSVDDRKAHFRALGCSSACCWGGINPPIEPPLRNPVVDGTSWGLGLQVRSHTETFDSYIDQQMADAEDSDEEWEILYSIWW